MIPKVLLFELSADGHYPSYVRYLVEGWNSRRGDLVVVVSQRFAERHRDWMGPERAGVSWQVLTSAETQRLNPRRYPWQRVLRACQEWDLIDRYVRRLGADHCLLPYLDSRRWPLLLHQPLSCGLTAIYFRPSFHYDRLQGQPSRWQYRLERLMVKRMLHHPALKTLLCLDGSAVVPLAALNPQIQVGYLPDPVATVRATPQQVETLRQRLQVEPGRRVLLFFGAIHRRKGIYPLLQALGSMGAEASQLCLVLAGEIDPLDNQTVRKRLQELPSQIQVIRQDQYLADSDLAAYFQMADLVLALYQHHVGMSGVLLRAAVAGRPVLCDRHGLIGSLTERYQLGQVVDATNPDQIARLLARWVRSPQQLSYCLQSMRQFAWLHRDSQFASTLLESMFGANLVPASQKISQPAPAASLG